MPEASQPKTMLITGGSRGIGAATARLAAARGWQVAINYTSNAAAAETLANAVRAQGARAMTVQADVADEGQVLAMFAAVDAQFGGLDALINNAGVVDVPCDVADMGLARWQRMFNINVIGSFLCAREAVRRMSTRRGARDFGPGYGRGGAIVNLSSAAARLGSPHQYVDYAAAKGAIDAMTIGLAKEVGAEGIRVNAVRPGLIETEIHASGGQPDRVRELAAGVPMLRGGTAEEVANAIVWLAGDEASYTTMSLLDVSGGR